MVDGLDSRQKMDVLIQSRPRINGKSKENRCRRSSRMVFGVDLEKLGLVGIKDIEDIHQETITIVTLDGHVHKEVPCRCIRIPLDGDKP